MLTPLTHPPTVGSTKTCGEIYKGSQQGISSKYPRAALPKSQAECHLLRNKSLSNEMETHVNVFAPSRTKRVRSQRYGPLIILKNPDTRSA